LIFAKKIANTPTNTNARHKDACTFLYKLQPGTGASSSAFIILCIFLSNTIYIYIARTTCPVVFIFCLQLMADQILAISSAIFLPKMSICFCEVFSQIAQYDSEDDCGENKGRLRKSVEKRK
jgi:hypothetical protein